MRAWLKSIFFVPKIMTSTRTKKDSSARAMVLGMPMEGLLGSRMKRVEFVLHYQTAVREVRAEGLKAMHYYASRGKWKTEGKDGKT